MPVWRTSCLSTMGDNRRRHGRMARLRIGSLFPLQHGRDFRCFASAARSPMLIYRKDERRHELSPIRAGCDKREVALGVLGGYRVFLSNRCLGRRESRRYGSRTTAEPCRKEIQATTLVYRAQKGEVSSGFRHQRVCYEIRPPPWS